ncbi:MAG: hypothetical protein MMC23_006682 [Stictis urceolatum]|nr:hypothetical protein [Stictis urceolata]
MSIAFSALLLAAKLLATPAPAAERAAAPEPTSAPVLDSDLAIQNRDLKSFLPNVLNNVESGLVSDLSQLSQIGSAYLTLIADTAPTATPASLSDVPSRLPSAIGTSKLKDILDSALSLFINGFKPKDLQQSVIVG